MRSTVGRSTHSSPCSSPSNMDVERLVHQLCSAPQSRRSPEVPVRPARSTPATWRGSCRDGATDLGLRSDRQARCPSGIGAVGAPGSSPVPPSAARSGSPCTATGCQPLQRVHASDWSFPSFTFRVTAVVRSATWNQVMVAAQHRPEVFGTDTPGDRQNNWDPRAPLTRTT